MSTRCFEKPFVSLCVSYKSCQKGGKRRKIRGILLRHIVSHVKEVELWLVVKHCG